MKLKYVSQFMTIWMSMSIASIAFAEAEIDIINGKAETNKGKISQIEAETNSALLDLQNQITNITLTPGPAGEKGDTGDIGPQGDDGALSLAGENCSIGSVVAGFNTDGSIICTAIDGTEVLVVGVDCQNFREGLVVDGELDLRNCDLRNLNRSNFSLGNADLEGADLRNSILTEFSFQNANLSGADLRGAILLGSDLTGANLSRADLSHADLGCANEIFSGETTASILGCTSLRFSNLTHTVLTGSNLKGADLSSSFLDGGVLLIDSLEGELPRPIWGNTICPDGQNSFNPDGDSSTCINNELP